MYLVYTSYLILLHFYRSINIILLCMYSTDDPNKVRKKYFLVCGVCGVYVVLCGTRDCVCVFLYNSQSKEIPAQDFRWCVQVSSEKNPSP